MRNISLFKYGALAALLGTTLLSASAEAQVLPGQGQPTFINLLDNGGFTVAQRGTTTVTAITTTAKYLWDRWAAYAGTATSSSLVNVAASLPTGTGTPVFTAAAQVQRTAAQAGVLPVCLVQEIPNSDIQPIAGQPVALSFWALAGSNFSAASSNLTVKITTGTVANGDEGLPALISPGWTGAANTTLNTTQAITSTWQRYAFTGNLPANATEAAVQICYTPTGTAGANDYFQTTGVQLQQGTVATNFEVRPLGIELAKDQRYFWQINEPAAGYGIGSTGVLSTTTNCMLSIATPVPMRAAPAITFGGTALSTSTWKIQNSTTSTLASTFLGAGAGQTIGSLNINATLTTASTAGWGCQLQGNAAGANIQASADF